MYRYSLWMQILGAGVLRNFTRVNTLHLIITNKAYALEETLY